MLRVAVAFCGRRLGDAARSLGNVLLKGLAGGSPGRFDAAPSVLVLISGEDGLLLEMNDDWRDLLRLPVAITSPARS